MKKSSLFISAALTTFVLVVLASAITVYRVNSNGGSQAGYEQSSSVSQPATPSLTLQQAAVAAAGYLGQSDLYSVESSVYKGTPAFKVIFSSGDVVYVATSGQVLAVAYTQAIVPQSGSQSNGSQPSFFSDDQEEEDND